MTEAKNIIFDLGGVLFDIDIRKTREAFIQLGFNRFDDMYTQYSADPLFANLETGKISADDFCSELVAKSGNGLDPRQIITAWNALLIGFRKQSVLFLQKLQPHYSIYLLSNTNSIHQDAFMAVFETETGLSGNFNQLFTKAYYSHEIGYRKPNADIFEYVLADAGLRASETLFIDDSYNNIDAAKALGFKTHLMLPGESIETLPELKII